MYPFYKAEGITMYINATKLGQKKFMFVYDEEMEFEKWSLAFHKVLFLSSKMNFPIYIALGNYAGMAPNYCICNYRELCKYLLGMLFCINVFSREKLIQKN